MLLRLAVLESQVRLAVLSAGLDPTIGYMHSKHGARSAFVLDLMEPLRPTVDRVVLGFVQDHLLSPADFILRDDGVCRLAPQLARTVAARSAVDVAADASVEGLIGLL
jgi:CRISPR/Cas system-associated endonuclease Cas1